MFQLAINAFGDKCFAINAFGDKIDKMLTSFAINAFGDKIDKMLTSFAINAFGDKVDKMIKLIKDFIVSASELLSRAQQTKTHRQCQPASL